MSAALALAAAAFVTGRPAAVWATAVAMALFIIFKHRADLRRLAAGTENCLGAARA